MVIKSIRHTHHPKKASYYTNKISISSFHDASYIFTREAYMRGLHQPKINLLNARTHLIKLPIAAKTTHNTRPKSVGLAAYSLNDGVVQYCFKCAFVQRVESKIDQFTNVYILRTSYTQEWRLMYGRKCKIDVFKTISSSHIIK